MTSTARTALDAAWQATANGKLFALLARTDSPAAKGGSDYAGRVYYSYANPVWSSAIGYSQVGDRFNPEVGFLQRQAYRRVESRYGFLYQPERWPSIRRFASSLNYKSTWIWRTGSRARLATGTSSSSSRGRAAALP
jgi:hypothetical protein